jgi:hypothetical protein
VAKSLVILEMMRAGAETDAVLQVRFQWCASGRMIVLSMHPSIHPSTHLCLLHAGLVQCGVDGSITGRI